MAKVIFLLRHWVTAQCPVTQIRNARSRNHSFTCYLRLKLFTHKWNKSYLLYLHSQSWSTFNNPRRTEGWVGLGTTAVSKQSAHDCYLADVAVVSRSSFSLTILGTEEYKVNKLHTDGSSTDCIGELTPLTVLERRIVSRFQNLTVLWLNHTCYLACTLTSSTRGHSYLVKVALNASNMFLYLTMGKIPPQSSFPSP